MYCMTVHGHWQTKIIMPPAISSKTKNSQWTLCLEWAERMGGETKYYTLTWLLLKSLFFIFFLTTRVSNCIIIYNYMYQNIQYIVCMDTIYEIQAEQTDITLTLQKLRMPQVQDVQGWSCSRLPRTLGNAGDAVSSAFPQGKKHDKFCTIFGFHIWSVPEI